MEQDPKEQAIVEWLQTVDKPLTTKEGNKKDTDRATNKAETGNR